LGRYCAHSGRPGIIVAAYAAELFGHWWFEGIPWMKEVLPLLSEEPGMALVTVGEYLEMCPPEEPISLPGGSWGGGNDAPAWRNRDTEWMWPLLHEADRCMEDLVARYPDATGERLEVLKQAARELLLLQGSDWPFMVTQGEGGAEYARGRFQEHRESFERLAKLAEKGSLDGKDRAFLQECQHVDNPFLNMDYRVFADREERVR
jgi:1,4-alpha-glucan branching enzyme